MSQDEYRRFTAEHKLEILREADQSGVTVREVCRRYALTVSVFYRWRAVAQGGFAVALKRGAQRTQSGDDPRARQKAEIARMRAEITAEDLKLTKKRSDDLYRAPSETKAAGMQIVVKTERPAVLSRGCIAHSLLWACRAASITRGSVAKTFRIGQQSRVGSTKCCPMSALRSASFLAVPEDRLSRAHTDDGRCGDSLRRRARCTGF